MSLSLTCRCGARFEVEETFAGQEVTCPQCQAPVKAPSLVHGPIRTSDFAIGSVVLALVGAFTIVGTLAAIVLGGIAIIRIQRNRQRLAGMGYAVAGIVLGVLFTALTTLAVSTGEVFGIGEQLRQRQLAGHVRDDADLEIVEGGADGFSITRPSHDWVVAKDELKHDLDEQMEDLVLVHRRRDAVVVVKSLGFNFQSADHFADDYLKELSKKAPDDPEAGFQRVSDVKLRDKSKLPPKDGAERVEMRVAIKVLGQPWMLLVRFIRTQDSHMYVVVGRAHVRVFKQLENYMEQMMDSFEPRAADQR